MKKKDILLLKYKVMKLRPKNSQDTNEPDWESMKINPESIKNKYNTELTWSKKTFEKAGIISIEENDDTTSIINHEEGVFVVQKKFKKLFNLIYK